MRILVLLLAIVVGATGIFAQDSPARELPGRQSSGQEPSRQEPSGQEPSRQEPSGQEPSDQGSSDDEPNFTLKVDVPLVALEVTVFNPFGGRIADLNKEEFVVFEDGQPQEIQNFTVIDIPYNMLLLFDRSSSTTELQPFLMRAITRFTETLQAHDRLAIAAFDEQPEMIVDWREASEGPREGLTINPKSPLTDFYGAIKWAVKQMSTVTGRKGILVFTDGLDPRFIAPMPGPPWPAVFKVFDPAKEKQFKEVLEAAREAETPIYFVAINTDRNPATEGSARKTRPELRAAARTRMEQLAATAGGRVLFPQSLEDTVSLYEQIARDLSTASYNIGYISESPGDDQYRSIEVQVRDKPYRIRQSRDGYFAK